MTVLSDKWIKKMTKEQGMISPFEDKQQKNNVISYGLSSYGYDARVSNEFGGIIQTSSFFVIKFELEKFLGSTKDELTFVKILNSFDTLSS